MSETTSRRQRILEALKARVEEITTANGFNTDAGKHVYMGWIPVLGPDDPSEAMAVIPAEDVVGEQLMKLPIQLPVNIAIVANAYRPEPWTTVEAGLTDIKKAVELEDRMLGGLLVQGRNVLGLFRGTTEVLPRESGSNVIGASITYVAPYTEAWGAPEV